jgi:hypothetical protein
MVMGDTFRDICPYAARADALPHLESLNLWGNFTEEIAEDVFACLAHHPASLRGLGIYQSRPHQSWTSRRIVQGLATALPGAAIARLSLIGLDVTGEEVVALTPVLSRLVRIEMEMDKHTVSPAAFSALAAAITQSETLSYIRIHGCRVESEEAMQRLFFLRLCGAICACAPLRVFNMPETLGAKEHICLRRLIWQRHRPWIHVMLALCTPGTVRRTARGGAPSQLYRLPDALIRHLAAFLP